MHHSACNPACFLRAILHVILCEILLISLLRRCKLLFSMFFPTLPTSRIAETNDIKNLFSGS